MVKSAVTVSLVEAARGGPFILWDGLEAGCKTAKELGFDAIEVFSLGPEQIDSDELEKLSLLKEKGLLTEEEFIAAKAKLLK